MSEHDPDATNPSQIEALITRLEDGQLRAEDRRLIGRLLRLLLTLIRVVEQKASDEASAALAPDVVEHCNKRG